MENMLANESGSNLQAEPHSKKLKLTSAEQKFESLMSDKSIMQKQKKPKTKAITEKKSRKHKKSNAMSIDTPEETMIEEKSQPVSNKSSRPKKSRAKAIEENEEVNEDQNSKQSDAKKMIEMLRVNPKIRDVEINIREKQLSDAIQRRKELEDRLKLADDDVSKYIIARA